MQIGYFPPPNKSNSYTINMYKLLGDIGEVSPVTPKRFIDFFKKQKFDFVFINWLENKAFRKDGRILISGILYSIAWFLILKLKSKKVVYVKHNNYPHNSKGLAKKLGFLLIDFFVRYADVVIVHSPASVTNSKMVYIPHPLYNVELMQNVQNPVIDKEYYICFGRIEKYKKIHELINYWPKDKCLKIQGICRDEEYLSTLVEMSVGKKITISTVFISDEDAYSLLKNSQGMIIPSDSDSMIVSGSFFFAMTVKTPVIAISTPFLNSFSDTNNFIFLIDSMRNINFALENLQVGRSVVTEDFVNNFSDERIRSMLKDTIFKSPSPN